MRQDATLVAPEKRIEFLRMRACQNRLLPDDSSDHPVLWLPPRGRRHGASRAGKRESAVLFVAWYNFCRNHMTLKTTPAVVARHACEAWTIERLLSESVKAAR
jgi:hypothetical protein